MDECVLWTQLTTRGFYYFCFVHVHDKRLGYVICRYFFEALEGLRLLFVLYKCVHLNAGLNGTYTHASLKMWMRVCTKLGWYVYLRKKKLNWERQLFSRIWERERRTKKKDNGTNRLPMPWAFVANPSHSAWLPPSTSLIAHIVKNMFIVSSYTVHLKENYIKVISLIFLFKFDDEWNEKKIYVWFNHKSTTETADSSHWTLQRGK